MAINEIFQLADMLNEAKEQKKDIDAKSKELGKQIEELDYKLSEAMAESELDKFSRGGKTFYLSSRLFASPVAGKKEELFKALKDNGYGSIVTETVNANTLASFVKEQMAENNEEVPSWLAENISTYEKVSVGIRKG